MTHKAVQTAGAPAAIGPYSQGIVTGGFLFCAGQAALDPATGTLVEGGIEPETEQVMANLSAVLGAAVLSSLAAAAPLGSAPAGLTLTASPVASPNGDGVKDAVAVVVDLPAPALLTVTVDAQGETVATLASSIPAGPGTVRLTWDGRSTAGVRVPDGLYAIEAAAVSAAEGSESAAETRVRIDTRPPAVRWIALRERPGAGPLRARYRLVELKTGEVVLDATAGSDAGIDVVSSEFATIAAEQTALENLSREVADRIVTRVTVALREPA